MELVVSHVVVYIHSRMQVFVHSGIVNVINACKRIFCYVLKVNCCPPWPREVVLAIFAFSVTVSLSTSL